MVSSRRIAAAVTGADSKLTALGGQADAARMGPATWRIWAVTSTQRRG
ncbi:MAG: hypothetical protein QOF92_4395 [Pseudonocardiales bacterium]|jgi:hypothetical protein|nr:hypothetical protein [Pseudonocardiales bacterium]